MQLLQSQNIKLPIFEVCFITQFMPKHSFKIYILNDILNRRFKDAVKFVIKKKKVKKILKKNDEKMLLMIW